MKHETREEAFFALVERRRWQPEFEPDWEWLNSLRLDRKPGDPMTSFDMPAFNREWGESALVSGEQQSVDAWFGKGE